MRVYLASSYANHPEMREWRTLLHADGHRVTSRWIDGDCAEYDDLRDAGVNLAEAVRAIEDLAQSDVVILDNRAGRNTTRGGRHVEFGMALHSLRVILVGERENVFHWLPQVLRVDSIEEAADMLRRWEGNHVVSVPG